MRMQNQTEIVLKGLWYFRLCQTEATQRQHRRRGVQCGEKCLVLIHIVHVLLLHHHRIFHSVFNLQVPAPLISLFLNLHLSKPLRCLPSLSDNRDGSLAVLIGATPHLETTFSKPTKTSRVIPTLNHIPIPGANATALEEADVLYMLGEEGRRPEPLENPVFAAQVNLGEWEDVSNILVEYFVTDFATSQGEGLEAGGEAAVKGRVRIGRHVLLDI
ncbi:hypothetical protein B0T13DRAFT_444262 [Neurospora crassa]|nr:hypothetical protein B0T13DRAFT_444262 [Neurospora crassa]